MLWWVILWTKRDYKNIFKTSFSRPKNYWFLFWSIGYLFSGYKYVQCLRLIWQILKVYIHKLYIPEYSPERYTKSKSNPRPIYTRVIVSQKGCLLERSYLYNILYYFSLGKLLNFFIKMTHAIKPINDQYS